MDYKVIRCVEKDGKKACKLDDGSIVFLDPNDVIIGGIGDRNKIRALIGTKLKI